MRVPVRKLVVVAVTLLGGCPCRQNDTVTGPGASIALSFQPGSATVPQGGATQAAGTLTRAGGFHGAVSFTLAGVPTGLTATLDGSSTSGDITTFTLSVQVGTAVTPGTSTITVQAHGAGVTDATAGFTLTVTAAPPNLILDASACQAGELDGVAFQDGSGPYTLLQPAASLYKAVVFSLTATYAIARHRALSGNLLTLVTLRKSDLPGSVSLCAVLPTPVTINGSATGLGGNDVSNFSFAGSTSFFLSPVTSFSLPVYLSGTYDATAFVLNQTTGANRFAIQRDRPTSAGVLPPFNLAVGTATPAAAATATISGLPANEGWTAGMSLYDGTSCVANLLWSAGDFSVPGASSIPIYGIPAAQERLTDFHGLFLQTNTIGGPPNTGSARQLQTMAHLLQDRVLVLPAEMPLPAVTQQTGTGNAKILSYAYSGIPAELTQLTVQEADNVAHHTIIHFFQPGTFAAPAGSITTPDLRAFTGFANAYPMAANPDLWTFTGFNKIVPECREGDRVALSAIAGTQ